MQNANHSNDLPPSADHVLTLLALAVPFCLRSCLWRCPCGCNQHHQRPAAEEPPPVRGGSPPAQAAGCARPSPRNIGTRVISPSTLRALADAAAPALRGCRGGLSALHVVGEIDQLAELLAPPPAGGGGRTAAVAAAAETPAVAVVSSGAAAAAAAGAAAFDPPASAAAATTSAAQRQQQEEEASRQLLQRGVRILTRPWGIGRLRSAAVRDMIVAATGSDTAPLVAAWEAQ